MSQPKHIHHYHRHMSFSYPASIRQRAYSLVLVPFSFAGWLLFGYYHYLGFAGSAADGECGLGFCA